MTYVLDKSRLSIRLVPPYSEERKAAASAYAKEHGFQVVGCLLYTSFVDGKRCREKTWFILRHEIDKICKEHNLSVVENGIRNSAPQYLTCLLYTSKQTGQTL